MYFGTSPNPSVVFDTNWLLPNEDTSIPCSVGMSFKENYVGVLDQVKYFLGEGEKSVFIDNLVFQGSNDGTNYADIFSADGDAHEGWNYVEFSEEEQPAFRFYRFYGKV